MKKETTWKVPISKEMHEQLEKLSKHLGLSVDELAETAVLMFVQDHHQLVDIDLPTYRTLQRNAQAKGLTVEDYIHKLVMSSDLS
jgi:NACalpha-BTF3-like transcription factor